MIDWIMIKLGLRLQPLTTLKQPRDRFGRYQKFNRVMERARLIREGK